MKFISKLLLFFLLQNSYSNSFAQGIKKSQAFLWEQGAIVRGNSLSKNISLVFTGDDFFEGLDTIIHILHTANIKASFFLTGRLYRNQEAYKSIIQLKSSGHYLGPHSDLHLLYNDWQDRKALLVSKDSMMKDLQDTYLAMENFGIQEKKKYFIPPYEWWNVQIARWCKENGIQIINFTPGTGTNADYTFPQMGKQYKSSDELREGLYRYEIEHGLNGAIILIHIGTDPRRIGKLYYQLPSLIYNLISKGYSFVRVDELLKFL